MEDDVLTSKLMLPVSDLFAQPSLRKYISLTNKLKNGITI